MKRSFVAIVGFMLILAACGSTKLIQPSQADVDRGAQKFSKLTLADLNQGKTIFEQNCNLCHGLKNPTSKNEDQWKKIVPKMVQKVNNKKGNAGIDKKSEEILLQYLITMSTAPVK
jgi:cytochrome c5